MNRLIFSGRVTIFLLASLAFCCSAADGQSPGYRPATPTFSPYLDYFKRDVGALDVYNSIVRPNRVLRSTLARQGTALSYQGTRIDSLQQSAQGRADVAPTGIGARFMDFSHFYSMPATGARRASRR